jgi:indolepyruvate ferredoxin oxidoreductase
MEDQISRLLWRMPDGRRPRLVGKDDETGAPLIPSHGALDATLVSRVLLRRLEAVLGADVARRLRPRETIELLTPSTDAEATGTELVRAAGFCSGCPHNTSTRVPEGAFAIGGTGCHGMAAGLAVPGRETHHFTHMGGEGALWIGMAPFAEQTHTFQNMGDGTYSHSGYLAVRAAIAAGVTMTFKILLNGYISMTGGQAIPGGLSAQQLAAQVLAEGARRVVVVSDDVGSYKGGAPFPAGVAVHDREELLAVEEELRAEPGVTVLVYDQACAAELRRERKRGRAVDPDKRTFIHETVCEGCGDCNVQSNCISVEPLDTDLGRKRQINQSTCNKDFTCVTGYCPSFVTLYGATPRRRGRAEVAGRAELLTALPEPPVAGGAAPYNVLIGGIGGGGVLTVGALVGMAAHLEGKAASVLNESGLAQKNGAVQSHVRVAADPATELSPRIGAGGTDLVLGADLVVVAGAGPLATMDRARTSVVVNRDVRPTVAFAGNGRLDLSGAPMERRLRRATGDRVEAVAADAAATDLMGDSIYANLFLLGFAAQRGLLPVSVAALERAIELNGVAVAQNREALAWGRLAAADPERVAAIRAAHAGPAAAEPVRDEPVDDLVARRRAFLVDYQDEAWARRYETAVRRVLDAEQRAVPGADELGRAAAENLFKLMAYKDEYEVARLYLAPEFTARLEDAFEGDYRVKVNLAPQIFNRRDRVSGRARKWEIPLGAARPAFAVLARARRLRGTPLDGFGRTAHRRAERARIDAYLAVLEEITGALTVENHSTAVQVASLPETIRGFDTVKDLAAEQAREKEAVLLEEFRAQTVAAGR